jgi:predicted DNA-binding protein (MmcQ/YjbR family)
VTPEACNAFCAGLPATSHVVQWGGSDVWKVGGKVFVIAGEVDGHFAVSFKVSELGFEALSDHPDCRPAPYLASRGMKWIQYYRGDVMDDDELEDLIRQSHAIVASGLPKKTRVSLGLT